jgi:hypothetical protein
MVIDMTKSLLVDAMISDLMRRVINLPSVVLALRYCFLNGRRLLAIHHARENGGI